MRRTSPSRLRTPVGSSRLLPALWFLLFSVLAGVCFWHGLGGGESSVSQQQAGQPVQQVTHSPEPKTAPIQDVRVGMRTAGKNPLREQVDLDAPEPDPETWRHLVIRMTKKGGGLLHINLLRELLWIEAVGAVEGESFFLELPEMGPVGDAFVVSIGPCPPIQSGPGNIVTGTFHHEADPGQKILRVEFSNGAVIEGVTDNHPFYSVDRRDYVAIGEMGEGDFVSVSDGITTIAHIESRLAYPGEMLYNLETYKEHVYQVTQDGILVHNTCPLAPGRGPVRPRHFAGSPTGVRLFAEAKAFRNRLPGNRQSKQYRNVVVADVLIDGKHRTV